MRKTLPQYNENEYYNLTDPDFIPNSDYIPKFLSRFPTRLDFIPIWETLETVGECLVPRAARNQFFGNFFIISKII